MKERTETRVGISVRGPEVEPSDVARVLGLQAEASHRRGDAFEDARGGVAYRDDGWCTFTSDGVIARDAGFEFHAAWMLDRLEPHIEVLESWTGKGWLVVLTITTVTNLNNGGPRASPTIMRRLGALSLTTQWRTICAPEHTGFRPTSGAH